MGYINILEKRKLTRIKSDKMVQVTLLRDTSIAMKMRDYSMAGVGITGPIYQAIPNMGDKLKVCFEVKLGSGFRTINVFGRVKYINLDGANYFLGLCF